MRSLNDPYDRVPPPRTISEVPAYLVKLMSGFFSRLAYTFKMVWETGHWILVCMVIIAVFWGSMAMSLLIFFFIYKIINQLVSRINIAVTRIAGEKVGRF